MLQSHAMRGCVILCVLLLSACEETPERNPPPVGSAGGGGLPTAGTVDPSGSDTDGLATTTATNASTGGSTTNPSTGGSTSAPFTALSGAFIDGGAGFPLPIECAVRFHFVGDINPATGVDTGFVFSRPFTIMAFPQSFAITSEEISDVVVAGDTGFVTAECDVDGDNFFDDNVGGYYPSLPLVEITLPGSAIDIPISAL